MYFEFSERSVEHAQGDVPVPFTHDFHAREIFSSDYIKRLATKYDGHADSYVAAGARSPDTVFRETDAVTYVPSQALERLSDQPLRVLFKRLEDHDAQFRSLRDEIYEEISASNGVLKNDKPVRVETAMFISSGSTITPFHFDPEVNYFSQIEGEKEFHCYDARSVAEEKVDAFYNKQVVDIAQVNLNDCDPAYEHVFSLRQGKGFYQPLNSPHWVKTGAARSVSYSIVVETEGMRARGKVRAWNHYMRKVGMRPHYEGALGGVEKLKIAAVDTLIPIRRKIGPTIRSVVGR